MFVRLIPGVDLAALGLRKQAGVVFQQDGEPRLGLAGCSQPGLPVRDAFMAAAALRALSRGRVAAVPGDVAVMRFDDGSRNSWWIPRRPWCARPVAMAEQPIDLLLSRIGGEPVAAEHGDRPVLWSSSNRRVDARGGSIGVESL